MTGTDYFIGLCMVFFLAFVVLPFVAHPRWSAPFLLFMLMMAFPPPADMALRVLVLIATLGVAAGGLVAFQPWKTPRSASLK